MVPAQGTKAGARKMYPFSIVPGGVLSRDELARVVKSDKVAAAHYADFAVDKAHPVRVAKARAVYVSYRKNGQVYWTSKKVMLAEGETLLSDGTSEIRTRCGNRISDTPRLPVGANEPSPQVLDTAMDADEDEGGAQPVSMAVPNDGPGGVGPTRTAMTFANGNGLIQGDNRMATAMSLLNLPSASQRPFDGGAPILLASSPASQTPQAGQASQTPAGAGTQPDAGAGTGGSGSGGNTGGGSDNAGSGAPATGGGTDNGSTPSTGGGTDNGGTPSAGGGDAPGSGSNGGQPPSTTPDLPPQTGIPPSTPITPSTPNNGTNDVPEPGSLWLSGLALAAMAALRRKPRQRR